MLFVPASGAAPPQFATRRVSLSLYHDTYSRLLSSSRTLCAWLPQTAMMGMQPPQLWLLRRLTTACEYFDVIRTSCLLMRAPLALHTSQ